MGIDERESIIEQLALMTGYNRSVFEQLSNDQLKKELEEHF